MAQLSEKSTVNDIKDVLDKLKIEYPNSANKSELLKLVPTEEGTGEGGPSEGDNNTPQDNIDTHTPVVGVKPDITDPIIDVPEEPTVPDVPMKPEGDSWSDIIMGGGQDGPKNNIPEENYYTVVEGDTLVSIANKFGTSVAKIKKLNTMTSNVVRVGRKLRLV